MAVIPEALVNPEAGLNLLKLGADGKNAGGGIFIAMLFTVPEFAKAQGTMVDKYKAFIGNTDAVNSVCRSRYGASLGEVEQACKNVFTFDPSTFKLTGGNASIGLWEVNAYCLYFGGVVTNRLVGVIDDSTRLEIARTCRDIMENKFMTPPLVNILKGDPSGLDELNRMGRKGVAEQFGPVLTGVFGEDGRATMDSVRNFYMGLREIAANMFKGGHPDIAKVIDKVRQIVTVSPEVVGNAAYAEIGEYKTRTAKVKTPNEFRVNQPTLQFFVFEDDIGAARDYLRSNGEPCNQFAAMELLVDTRRSGDRRFPRWGFVNPEKFKIGGTKNMLLGDMASGNDGTWKNLLSEFLRAAPGKNSDGPFNEIFVQPLAAKAGEDSAEVYKKAVKLYNSLLADIKNAGPGKSETFQDSEGFQKSIRPPMQIDISGANEEVKKLKMSLMMQFLGKVASGYRTSQSTKSTEEMGATGKEGDSLQDSVEASMTDAAKNGAIQTENELRNIVNTPSINSAFSAVVALFSEFPELRESDIFKNNRELLERFREGVYALRSTGINKDLPMDENDITLLVAETLRVLVSGLGVYGGGFFDPSKFKLEDRDGLVYVSDWGYTEKAQQYAEQYRVALAEKEGELMGGQHASAVIRNMLPYILLTRQYGGQDSRKVSGAIRQLVEFESDLSSHLERVPKKARTDDSQTLDEIERKVSVSAGTKEARTAAMAEKVKGLHAEINLANLNGMFASHDPKLVSVPSFDELVTNMFLRKYPKFEDRAAFYIAKASTISSESFDAAEHEGILGTIGVSGDKPLEELYSFIETDHPDLEDAVKNVKPHQRKEMLAILLDYGVRERSIPNIGLALTSADPSIAPNIAKLPLAALFENPAMKDPFTIGVENIGSDADGDTEDRGPIGPILDEFLGELYGLGDGFVEHVAKIFANGDAEGLGELVTSMYRVDGDNPGQAIITIPSIRPTAKALRGGKLDAELVRDNKSAQVARKIRNQHTADDEARLNSDEADSDDEISGRFRRAKVAKGKIAPEPEVAEPQAAEQPKPEDTPAAPAAAPQNVEPVSDEDSWYSDDDDDNGDFDFNSLADEG